MPDFLVRPYQSTDREAVFRIAADTAFFGEPVEAFLDDRRLFCDFFYAFYTDLEPDHGWVACADQEVVGFLMGCTDTRSRPRRWIQSILPVVTRQLAGGGYRLGWRTIRYVTRLMLGGLRGERLVLDVKAYPAHLHVNLSSDWRGQGLGGKLLAAFIEQLRALEMPGVHLSTTSANAAACHLYERSGFRLLSACTTRMWEGLVQAPLEERIYGLRLT